MQFKTYELFIHNNNIKRKIVGTMRGWVEINETVESETIDQGAATVPVTKIFNLLENHSLSAFSLH